MSLLAPLLEGFFTQRLGRQRNASPNTVAAYRDTFRLLLRFVDQETGKAPAKLALEDLDATIIGAFLEHLETSRGNGVRTRNARLTAIHSFFRYCALRVPERAELIQRVLAIPEKRFDTALVSYLVRPEIDTLLAAPDPQTWTGRRDHAMLLLAVQTGLRVSELAGVRSQDVELGVGAHIRCRGKGRKERSTPLPRATVAVLRAWLRERGGQPDSPLFPSRKGRQLTRGAIWRLVVKHAASACERCPTLVAKRVTPQRPPPHGRDDPAARRGRHLDHRSLARPRGARVDQHLPARRHGIEGTCSRPHGASQQPGRPLPRLRRAARLPGRPVGRRIMSSPRPRPPPRARGCAT